MSLIKNKKNEEKHLLSVKMPPKQLLKSTDHGVNDTFVIRQYFYDFRNSFVVIQIFKIKRVKDVHQQLMNSILKLLLNKNRVKVSVKCPKQ